MFCLNRRSQNKGKGCKNDANKAKEVEIRAIDVVVAVAVAVAAV
jgi:hypothetical protein